MVERPLILRKESPDHIFLQFMNREMHRFAEVAPTNQALLEIFLNLFLYTRGPYYTSLSFVLEDPRYAHPDFFFLRHLLTRGTLDVLSDATDLVQHVRDRQATYIADRHRYPVYFDDRLTSQIWASPTITTTSSASSALRASLLHCVDDRGEIFRLPLPQNDIRIIDQHRGLIVDRLTVSPDQGITMTLFETEGVDARGLASLGKLLSLLHLRHYINESGADILTGIPQMRMLDGVAKSYPLYDFPIQRVLTALLLPDTRRARSLEVLEALAGAYHPKAHADIIEAGRTLVGGALYAATNERTPRVQIRSLVIQFLRNLAQNSRQNTLGGEVLGSIRVSIKYLEALATRTSARFAEYSEMASSFGGRRDGRVLIVTAANVEIDLAFQIAKQKLGSGLVNQRDPIGSTTVHFLGSHAGAEIFLCQVEAGDEGVSSLRLALPEVLRKLRIDYVLLTGICYGLRPDKQVLGGIVVSKQVQAFNLQRRTGNSSGVSRVTLRGPKAEPSPILLDRSRAARLDWNTSPVEHELYMSGSVLSDDKKFVKELLTLQPEARAAEMEGHGIYAVCSKEKVDWIIAKSICDWGYNKDDKHQQLAASNALGFVFHMIGQGGLSISR